MTEVQLRDSLTYLDIIVEFIAKVINVFAMGSSKTEICLFAFRVISLITFFGILSNANLYKFELSY